MRVIEEKRYSANLTAGSLKVSESRILANLFLQGISEKRWDDALYSRNILQTRNPETARRLARLIRARLALMKPDLWKLVRDGSSVVATQACLAAAIKHSPLLGDFLDLIVRDQYRLFRAVLSKPLWEDYLNDCRGRDPEMPAWTESTRRRLRSSVFQMLAQAGYLESTRTRKLQPVYISSEVLQYLRYNQETYVLRCMEVSP